MIGFYHEHTRADRDEYIKVNYEKIPFYIESQFEKRKENESNTLGYGYDYASIMHYSSHAGSYDDEPTIEAIDEGIVFGIAKELSPLDVLKANALYKCGESLCTIIITTHWLMHLYIIVDLYTLLPCTL